MNIRKITKAFTAGLLAAAMAVGCVSCGNAKSDKAEKTVYVILMVENGAFIDMKDGFINELRDKGYTENKLNIVYKCAQGDATNLATIVQDAVSQKPDAIATVGTPASQAVVGMESGIPNFFISVSDPVAAGLISDMNGAPDKNATGTSNFIPIKDIFEFAKEFTPDVQTYGILYNTGEINSVTTAQNAMAYLDEAGLKYIEKTVTSAAEVQTAAESLMSDVDAIYVPNDSVVQSAMPVVAAAARENGIPVFGSSAVMVRSGAFATKAISDTKIGAITADKCIEYLEGKAITEIKSEIVDADDVVINKNAADALGIAIPESIMSSATMVEDSNQ